MASPFFFQASSCNLIVGGNLGVGTDTPTSKLTVWGASRFGTTSNTTTQSTNYGQWQNRMEYVSPNQSLTQLYNLSVTYPLALTANRTMFTNYNECVLCGLGSSTNGSRLIAYGIRNNIENGLDYGEGHIYSAYGTFNYIVNMASIASNANTIQNSWGTYNYMRQYRDGVTSNSYGVYNNMQHDAGTFVNSYGCYVVTDTTILNSYGIYCTGEQKNYFAGNVGIGTTTPQTALSVIGTVSATALVGDGNGLTNTLSGSISSASASGADIDFNNIIPSWAKRITVIFNGVSTNGTAFKYIRVGYGSTPTYYSTGYQTGSARFSGSASSASVATVGFLINSGSTGDILNGSLIITKLTGNYWSCMGNVTYYSSGTITMAGGINMTTNVLTSIRITTGNGTDQYDAGIITVMYE